MDRKHYHNKINNWYCNVIIHTVPKTVRPTKVYAENDVYRMFKKEMEIVSEYVVLVKNEEISV